MGWLLFIRAHNRPAYKEIDTSQLTVLPLAGTGSAPGTQAFQQQTVTILGNQFATYTGSIHTLSASELLLKSDGTKSPRRLYHFY